MRERLIFLSVCIELAFFPVASFTVLSALFSLVCYSEAQSLTIAQSSKKN